MFIVTSLPLINSVGSPLLGSNRYSSAVSKASAMDMGCHLRIDTGQRLPAYPMPANFHKNGDRPARDHVALARHGSSCHDAPPAPARLQPKLLAVYARKAEPGALQAHYRAGSYNALRFAQ